MKVKNFKKLALAGVCILTSSACQAQQYPSPKEVRDSHTVSIEQRMEQRGFENWVAEYKKEALAKGISQQTLDAAFADIILNERAIELDRKQPEGTMTWAQYKQRIVNDVRIREGRKKLAENRTLLNKVSDKYGVQPQYIVALWAIETNFGSNMGNFNLVESLASLAYEGRRHEFFRGELTNALKILDQGHISVEKMKGSWAGAMGQCQFMPSSFLNFAVDFDGDGRKDIWGSKPDVFASIANYLSKSGWKGDETWGRAVTAPASAKQYAGLKQSKKLKEWAALGVKNIDGSAIPVVDREASLVYPDDVSGEGYLVYTNYKTIMKWNRSTYFATSVGMLADAIANHQ